MWIKLKASKHKIRVKISIFPLKSIIQPGVVFFSRLLLALLCFSARFLRIVYRQDPLTSTDTEIGAALFEIGKLITTAEGSLSPMIDTVIKKHAG